MPVSHRSPTGASARAPGSRRTRPVCSPIQSPPRKPRWRSTRRSSRMRVRLCGRSALARTIDGRCCVCLVPAPLAGQQSACGNCRECHERNGPHRSNRQRARPCVRGRREPHASRRSSRSARPHRNEGVLRGRRVRRVHGRRRWYPDELVPHAGRRDRWSRRDQHRGIWQRTGI